MPEKGGTTGKGTKGTAGAMLRAGLDPTRSERHNSTGLHSCHGFRLLRHGVAGGPFLAVCHVPLKDYEDASGEDTYQGVCAAEFGDAPIPFEHDASHDGSAHGAYLGDGVCPAD